MGAAATSEPAAAPPDPTTWSGNVAIRLADEGVPVNAIARCVKRSSSDIREILNEAYERSQIICVPRDDWPKGSQRDTRLPDTVRVDMTDPVFTAQIMRCIGVTGTQAVMLGALIRRPEMTRASLLLLIQKDNPDDPIEEKNIDVQMCKMRKRLEPQGLLIHTIWGRGYFLDPDSRKKIMEKLGLPVDPSGLAPDRTVGHEGPTGVKVQQVAKA